VGVDRQSGDAEAFHADDVGCFAADTGQGGQVFEFAGNDTMVIVNKDSGQSVEVFGFVTVEAQGADVFFQIRRGAGQEFLQGGVVLKKISGDKIHLTVGGLRAEDGGDQQLKSTAVFELTAGIRPEFA